MIGRLYRTMTECRSPSLPQARRYGFCHTSRDGAFCFIQSYYYVGWADADDIADAEGSSDWDAYARLLNMTENASQDLRFAVITDPLLEVKGTKLDMGTALLLSETQSAESGTYRILLPGKDADGRLIHTETELSAASASLGYLDYTFRNFYIQAFKYVGTPYGWGGMKDGVDCSSYVLSVFKTFGFVFPRNTGQQNGSVGNITNTEASQRPKSFPCWRRQIRRCALQVRTRYDLSRRYK